MKSSLTRAHYHIYILCGFAFVVTVVLFAGINSAYAEGEIFGIKVIAAGPIAGFITILLIFKLIGFVDVEEDEYAISEVEPNTLKQSELKKELNKLNYKKSDLITIVEDVTSRIKDVEGMISALDENKDYHSVVTANGMRAAVRRRPT